MIIEINKDIDKYQESVVMGLTAKQLIFTFISVIVGGSIVLLLYKYIGLTGAAYVAIPCVAPIALGGFYSYNGMTFYEVVRKRIYFMFQNKHLTYVSTEGENAIAEYQNKLSSKKYSGRVNKKMKKKTKGIAVAFVIGIVSVICLIVLYKYRYNLLEFIGRYIYVEEVLTSLGYICCSGIY